MARFPSGVGSGLVRAPGATPAAISPAAATIESRSPLSPPCPSSSGPTTTRPAAQPASGELTNQPRRGRPGVLCLGRPFRMGRPGRRAAAATPPERRRCRDV